MHKYLKYICIGVIIIAFTFIFISCKNGDAVLVEEEISVVDEAEDEEALADTSSNGEEELEEEEAESIQEEPETKEEPEDNEIKGDLMDTLPKLSGSIMIGNVGEFSFEPSEIKTVREDIFNEGYFSVFDILVYLDDKGSIDMEYHFAEIMNTYVIDSINDMENWWYIAYYDGGWPERNVFRMDHYPYKDRMYISISEFEKRQIDEYYKVFSAEIVRKNNSDGKIIIPEITIWTPTDKTLIFENVEVKPHDLRSDMFKPGVITAIDAIMTLGDEGKIKYGLQWFRTIGTAGIVKNYFVDRINNDSTLGRCGYVYEEGSQRFYGFQGNHIHLPSDARVINSPEYLFFVYLCI